MRFEVRVALLALAMLLPVRSLDQLLYEGAFALAFFSFWLWGQALGRRLPGLPPLRTFTAIFLGQLLALAASHVATAAGALSSSLFGVAPPLTWLVPAASVFLLYRQRKVGFPASRDLLKLFGIGCFAVAIAVWSRSLSAVGLDTHEHIAWAEQILKLGHVPLAEPGTAIVADYPRLLHLWTALWTAAGLGLPAGPFLKMMPFLQNALAMLAVAEILEEAAVRRTGESARLLLQVALGAAFYVYSFLLVPLVYPDPDLSGTGRYASSALLMAPVVLLLLAALHRSSAAGVLAWATAPLLGAWALTLNPITPPLLLAVTVPLGGIFWLALRPPLRGRWAGTATLSAALAVLCVVQDPWVASQAAKRSPRVAALLERGGLRDLDGAVRAGLATAREKSVLNAKSSPPCADRACVQRLASQAFLDAVSLLKLEAAAAVDDARGVAAHPALATFKHAFDGVLPLRPAAISDYSALPYLLVVAAGALLALLRAVRRKTSWPEHFLAAAIAGAGLCGVLLSLTAGLAGAFDDQTHDFRILDGYLHWAPHHVSLSLLWLPFAGASAVLASSVRARFEKLHPLLLVVWVALPLTAWLNLHVALRNPGFFTPVHLADLRAFHSVERAIPAEDGVLIPAEHWNVAEWEHWVIPVGPTTALLPYGNRRYLFDVYLGPTYPLSWRDLEDRLCSHDPAVRRAFLDRQRVRWLLVRDEESASAAEALHKQKMCGEPLSSLGAVLPEVRSERGISLFRIP